MLPDIPRELAVHPGPFASVYLDVSRDHQGAPREVRLRWEELARQLHGQGADPATVDAVGEAMAEPTGRPGSTGRAVFAAGGRVLLEAEFPGPPRRELARWSLLPHLMPLLTQLPELVPHVVVVLDRKEARVRGIDRAGREVLSEDQHGTEYPVHKVRGGGSAHLGMQRRIEEVHKDNAKSFAADIDQAVSRLHAELVVLTGDVQARTIVLDALGERSRAIAVQVSGPGPDDTTTDEDIDEQVGTLAAERAAEHTRRAVETFERERGRGAGLAVTGLGPVIHALQRNQAATVLLRDDPSSDLLVWVGPEPAQLALTESDLRGIDAPVLGQDRADAALVRAIAGTGSELVLLPHPEAGSDPRRAGSVAGGAKIDQQPELSDGVGAVLRFSSGVASR